MRALYPQVVCEPPHDIFQWKVILPFGKGEVLSFLHCHFVKIDKTRAPLQPEHWRIVVARIDKRWSLGDPDWWDADFSCPIYLPYPQ